MGRSSLFQHQIFFGCVFVIGIPPEGIMWNVGMWMGKNESTNSNNSYVIVRFTLPYLALALRMYIYLYSILSISIYI